MRRIYYNIPHITTLLANKVEGDPVQVIGIPLQYYNMKQKRVYILGTADQYMWKPVPFHDCWEEKATFIFVCVVNKTIWVV